MLKQEALVSKTQMQLSTGLKNLTPADDPIAAKQVLDLQKSIDTTNQYQRNADTVRARNSLEESVLTSSRDALLRARDLAVQALNDGALKSEDKLAIADEIKQIRSQVLGLANTQDANGEYIFSGALSTKPTFAQAPTYTFQGSGIQRDLQIGPNRTLPDGDLGKSIFNDIPTASAAPPATRSIFATLGAFVDALSGAVTPYHDTVNKALADIDSTLKTVGNADAKVGARLRALDSQDNENASHLVAIKTTLSATKDLDYASAISDFQLQQNVLQAAQKSFSQVQKLSLFQYL